MANLENSNFDELMLQSQEIALLFQKEYIKKEEPEVFPLEENINYFTCEQQSDQIFENNEKYPEAIESVNCEWETNKTILFNEEDNCIKDELHLQTASLIKKELEFNKESLICENECENIENTTGFQEVFLHEEIDIKQEMQELLIKKVRQCNYLYNVHSSRYRDQIMRYEAWEQIGKELQITASEARDMWAKLRNCYSNALKRRRHVAKKYLPWRYEKEMSFLQPYIETRQTLLESKDPSQCPEERMMEEEEEEDQIVEDTEASKTEVQDASTSNAADPQPQPQYPPKRRKPVNSAAEIIGIRKRNARLRVQKAGKFFPNNFNETDMFYLSMSRTIQKLSELDQVRIRMELCRLVSEAEIRQIQAQTRALTPNQSTADTHS